jgi:hypothetical protein
MQFDLAAERFGKPFKRLACTLQAFVPIWWSRRYHGTRH